jgi:hypothetical protein
MIHPDLIEIPGFAPVRIELIQLLKYWYREMLNLHLWFFQTGAAESRALFRCEKREEKICAWLSKDDIDKAYQEAREEFQDMHRSCLDEHDWNVFFYGSEEQRDELLHKQSEILESALRTSTRNDRNEQK